jgi:hypothetical protein
VHVKTHKQISLKIPYLDSCKMDDVSYASHSGVSSFEWDFKVLALRLNTG